MCTGMSLLGVSRDVYWYVPARGVRDVPVCPCYGCPGTYRYVPALGVQGRVPVCPSYGCLGTYRYVSTLNSERTNVCHRQCQARTPGPFRAFYETWLVNSGVDKGCTWAVMLAFVTSQISSKNHGGTIGEPGGPWISNNLGKAPDSIIAPQTHNLASRYIFL